MSFINKKTFVKSSIYRSYSSIVTFLTSFIITGNIGISTSIGIMDSVFKIFTYYFFDVTWKKITSIKYRRSVVWLTGLSGAGKTTIAKLLVEKLQAKGEPAVLLDGDEIREIFNITGFDKKSRDENVRMVGRIAAFLQRRGTIAVVSMISPYSDVRKECRDMAKDFTEVHVSTPLTVCERRDVKGLYKRVRAGEIKSFTGIHEDAPYQEPVYPELVIDTQDKSINECVEQILTELKK